MAKVDTSVVRIKLDNKQFANESKRTEGLLRRLQEKMHLKGGSDGLDKMASKMSSMPINKLADGVDKIAGRFSNLGVVATTALVNISNKMTDAALNATKQFTVQPLIDGWDEYELKMNSIQTIWANTHNKGTTMDDINKALDELNHYADKTIYNFAEMTRNIGTFTAAGVDLKTSVDAIKGVANLAAISGSNSQQASTAMYQLSQALAAGTVKLQDWNSVVNAGMGGQGFQEQLKLTARVHGNAVDEMIADEGSFRESLKHGWLTANVLTETLQMYAGDLSEVAWEAKGYTKEQAKQIVQLGKDAQSSAQDYRTLGQVISTIPEMLGSSWATTWEIIAGNFEEASKLWTVVGNSISDTLDAIGDARNRFLLDWKKAGGRDALLEGLGNIIKAITEPVKAIGKAFQEVFKPLSGKRLADATKGFAAFTKMLIPTEGVLKGIKVAAKGFFTVIKDGLGFVGIFFGLLGKGVQFLGSFAKALGSTAVEQSKAFGAWVKATGILEKLQNSVENSQKAFLNLGKAVTQSVSDSFMGRIAKDFANVNKTVVSSFHFPKIAEKIRESTVGSSDSLSVLKEVILGMIEDLNAFIEKNFNFPSLKLGLDHIADLSNALAEGFRFFWTGAFGSPADKAIAKMSIMRSSLDPTATGVKKLWGQAALLRTGFVSIASSGDLTVESLKRVQQGMADSDNVAAQWLSGPLEQGEKFRQFLANTGKALAGFGVAIKNAFHGAFDWLDGAKDGQVQLVGILETIRSLTVSGLLASLSVWLYKVGKGWGKMKGAIVDAMGGITEAVENIGERVKPNKLGQIARAVFTLAGAMLIISRIDKDKLLGASLALGTLMTVLSANILGISSAFKKFDLSFESIKMGLTLIGLAASIMILAEALRTIAEIDTLKLLASFGVLEVIIFSLVGASALIKTVSVSIQGLGTSMLMFGVGLLAMAGALAILAAIPQDKLIQGGIAIAALSAIIKGFSIAMREANIIGVAASLMALAAAVNALVLPIIILGNAPLKKLAAGLAAMGLSIYILVKALKSLTDVKIVTVVPALLAFSIAMTSIAFSIGLLATIPLDRLAVSTIAFAASMATFILSMKALSKFTISKTALASMAIMAVTITAIANAMKKLASIGLGGMVTSLVTLGGSLVILITAIKLLGEPTVGVGILMLTGLAAALNLLADPLVQFGHLQWDQIGRALVTLAYSITILGLLGAAAGFLAIPMAAGAAALILMGGALRILAGPLLDFANLPADKLAQIFFTLENVSKILVQFLVDMSKASPLVAITSAGLVNISKAISIIAKPFKELSKIDFAASKRATRSLKDIIRELTEGLKLADQSSVFVSLKAKGTEHIANAVATVTSPFITLSKVNFSQALDGTKNLKTVVKSLADSASYVEQTNSIFSAWHTGGVTNIANALSEVSGVISTLSNLDTSKAQSAVANMGTILSALSEATSKITSTSGILSGMQTEGIKNVVEALNNAVDPLLKLKDIDTASASQAIHNLSQVLNALTTSVQNLSNGSILDGLRAQLNSEAMKNLGDAVSQAIKPLKEIVDLLQKFPADVTPVASTASKLQAETGKLCKVPDQLITGSKELDRAIKVFDEVLSRLVNATNKINNGAFWEGNQGAEKLKAFGQAIQGFTNSLGGLASLSPDQAQSVGTAISALFQSLEKFANSQLDASTIANRTAVLGELIATMGRIGPQIESYASQYARLNSTVQSSSLDRSFDALAKSLSTYKTSISNSLTAIEQSIKNYAEHMSPLGAEVARSIGDPLAKSVDNIAKIASQAQANAKSVMDAFIAGLRSQSGAVESTMSSIMLRLGNVILTSSATARTNAQNGANNLVKALASTLQAGRASVRASVQQLVKAIGNEFSVAINAIKNSVVVPQAKSIASALAVGLYHGLTAHRDSVRRAAYNLGYQVVIGTANGINDNRSIAIQAAANMAALSLQAARKRLEVRSPSRKFYEVGSFVVQGLANGIMDTTPLAEAAAVLLAKDITDTYNVNVIQKMQETKEETAERLRDTEIERPAAYEGGADVGRSYGDGLKEEVKSAAEAAAKTGIYTMEEQKAKLKQYIAEMFGQARADRIKFEEDMKTGVVYATSEGRRLMLDQINPGVLLSQFETEDHKMRWLAVGSEAGAGTAMGFKEAYKRMFATAKSDDWLNMAQFKKILQEQGHITGEELKTAIFGTAVGGLFGESMRTATINGVDYAVSALRPNMLLQKIEGQAEGQAVWVMAGQKAGMKFAEGMQIGVGLAPKKAQAASGMVTGEIGKMSAAGKAASDAFVSNTDKILQSIQKIAQQISTQITQILAQITKNIAKSKEEMSKFALAPNGNPLDGVQEAIANGEGSVTKTVGDVTITAVACVEDTLQAQSTKLESSGRRFIDVLLNAIVSRMNSQRSYLYNSSYSTGQQVVNGMTAAIIAGQSAVASAVAVMAAAAVESAKKSLKVKSPSRVFKQIGHYTVEGFALGLSDISPVEAATNVLTERTISNVKDAMKSLPELLDSDMELHPTITPVLDLSGLNSQVGAINKMMPSTVLLATQAASSFPSAMSSSQNGAEAKDINITFNQTNQSPKALSRTDIYRQTRNQVSQLRSLDLNAAISNSY